MMEKISENHKERSRTVKERTKGRVTIPTDLDVVPETLELLERWGADAIRDCDGTDYPEELKNADYYYYEKRQYMGESQSGRDSADVYYDTVLHSGRG